MSNSFLKSIAVLLIFSSCSNKPLVYTQPNQVNNLNTIESPFSELKIDSLLKKHDINGVSISYINDRFDYWTNSYGYSDEKKIKPVKNTTQFQAAEISQTIATIATLVLTETDKISLDSDASKFIKEFDIENNYPNSYISIRNVLKHRGGFNISSFSPYKKLDSLPNSLEILNGETPAINDPIKVIYEPLKTLQYSDGGYHFIQVMIEKLMRESYSEFVANYLFDQLEMKNSSFTYPIDTSNTSYGFNAENTRIEGNWNIYPQSSAQGLWMTSADLAQVVKEMLLASNGKSRTISYENFQEMLNNELSLNYDYNKKVFGYFGQNEGFTAYFTASTESFKGIVIMVNSANGGALINDILRLVE